MTAAARDLPPLDEPPSGTACASCGEELRIVGFCAPCFEASLQAREAAIRAQLAEAKRRARTWQLGRAVSA